MSAWALVGSVMFQGYICASGNKSISLLSAVISKETVLSGCLRQGNYVVCWSSGGGLSHNLGN